MEDEQKVKIGSVVQTAADEETVAAIVVAINNDGSVNLVYWTPRGQQLTKLKTTEWVWPV